MSSVVILSLCVVGCVFCGMGVYAGDPVWSVIGLMFTVAAQTIQTARNNRERRGNGRNGNGSSRSVEVWSSDCFT